jgi:hypothetical protein
VIAPARGERVLAVDEEKETRASRDR